MARNDRRPAITTSPVVTSPRHTSVGVAVGVGAGVGVLVGVGDGAAVGVAVGSGVAVAVAVGAGVSVGVGIGVSVGVGVGSWAKAVPNAVAARRNRIAKERARFIDLILRQSSPPINSKWI